MSDTSYTPALLLRPGMDGLPLMYDNINFKGNDGQYPLEIQAGMDGKIAVFHGCTFTGIGDGVDAVKLRGYVKAVFIECKFLNQYGKGGGQKGKALHAYKSRGLVIQHCEWGDNSGVYLQESDEYAPAFNAEIVIKYNKGYNITKARLDGTDGGNHAQFIQLLNLQGYNNIEIDTFEGINEYGKTWIEDGISIDGCKGTAINPIKISNICIRGIYPGLLFTGKDYSGSGLTGENHSEWVLIKNLYLIDCMNACSNIMGGSNITVDGFYFISASLKGNKSSYYWAAESICDTDGTPPDLFSTNKYKNGVVGYNTNRELSYYFPAKPFHNMCNIRRDITGFDYDNWMNGTEFISLTGTVTAETEELYYQQWRKELQARGVYVGITNDLTTTTTTTTTNMADLTLVEGQFRVGKIDIVGASGKSANYTLGTVDYSSSDTTIAKAVEDVANEKAFTITALKGGTANITVKFTSNTNKLVTKTFKVTVQAKEEESTDMVITFS